MNVRSIGSALCSSISKIISLLRLVWLLMVLQIILICAAYFRTSSHVCFTAKLHGKLTFFLCLLLFSFGDRKNNFPSYFYGYFGVRDASWVYTCNSCSFSSVLEAVLSSADISITYFYPTVRFSEFLCSFCKQNISVHWHRDIVGPRVYFYFISLSFTFISLAIL